MGPEPNYSDGMGELLSSWEAAGGSLFNSFVDVGRSSKWGSWGALRHLNDKTARYEQLMAFNKAHPRRWDEELQNNRNGSDEPAKMKDSEEAK